MAAKKVVKKKVVKPVKAIKNVKSKKKPEKLTYYYLDGTTSSKLDPKRILHREDGPALEWNDEYKEWHIKGNLIANKDKHGYTDGFAHVLSEKQFKAKFAKAIKRSKEDKYYYLDGTTSSEQNCSKILHRADGPAFEDSDGTKCWYINGNLHREDGPAVEYNDGNVEYWLNDKKYSKEDFDKEIYSLTKSKTGFDKYFDKQMESKEFANAYNSEKQEIDTIDSNKRFYDLGWKHALEFQAASK